MMSHFSRHECSLLILDRCEAAIGNARTQFVWFVDPLLSNPTPTPTPTPTPNTLPLPRPLTRFVNQLLSKASELKVLVATQVPLGANPNPRG